MPQQAFPSPNEMPPNFNPNNPYVNTPSQTQIGNVFAQPIVQDMAFQYGQQVNTKYSYYALSFSL